MTHNGRDVDILRDLATQYAERAAKAIQEERRELWEKHFSLKRTRPPILIRYGIWNVWCRKLFGDAAMECEDPFFREHERWLRMQLFHDSLGDDYILEPWITQEASYKTPQGIYGEPWGANVDYAQPGIEGGSWKADPFIKDWQDVEKLTPPAHEIDEEKTARDVQRLRDAIGDILEVNVDRGPVLLGFAGDISTTIAVIRGLDQLMYDMYESPEELGELLAFLRDGILANQAEAERAGDFSLTNHNNQAMPYAEELERPRANAGSRKRQELWGFFAAQEYTLISPDFHDQFLFQYQLPIMEKFGLVHYGCCEDLTRKIDMVRQLNNLRSIAVTPSADVWKCAEQIGSDYVISWRPSPAEMVCTGWDETHVREVIRDGMEACKDGVVHISLKDVETLQGDPGRLRRWTQTAREVVEEY
jgi:hypothetical protein